MAEQDRIEPPADPQDLGEWRKRVRALLMERRFAHNPRERAEICTRVKERMLEHVDLARYAAIGIYWPMRGEMDVRDIGRRRHEAGGQVALPVVVDKRGPLEFWRWHPEQELVPGVWNIPIPAQRELVKPDALIVPLLGFDRAGYRLGYGGGYYDRTLAASNPRPFCIGLGYADAELETIYPQPYDLPMDLIVTNEAVRRIS